MAIEIQATPAQWIRACTHIAACVGQESYARMEMAAKTLGVGTIELLDALNDDFDAYKAEASDADA